MTGRCRERGPCGEMVFPRAWCGSWLLRGMELNRDRLWFTGLGPVRAWRNDLEIDLGAPQHRTMLALLLAQGGRPISVAEIVDGVWGQDPPDTAVNSVHRV